jgi:transcription elongation GreA/GreB family factor
MKVAFGALVETTMGYFFVSIGAGIIDLDTIKFMTISPQAPIGRLILGKTTDETFEFRGKTHKIIAIA